MSKQKKLTREEKDWLTNQYMKKTKAYNKRAPKEKNVPDGNEVRKRDQEYSQDNWNKGVEALGPNPNSLMGDAPTPKDMKSIHEKLDALDAKLEFLLKYLEL